MKLFRCDHCSNVIYFENTVCESCGHALGYWHEANMMVSLEPVDELKRRYGAATLEEAFFAATGKAFEDEKPEDGDD